MVPGAAAHTLEQINAQKYTLMNDIFISFFPFGWQPSTKYFLIKKLTCIDDVFSNKVETFTNVLFTNEVIPSKPIRWTVHVTASSGKKSAAFLRVGTHGSRAAWTYLPPSFDYVEYYFNPFFNSQPIYMSSGQFAALFCPGKYPAVVREENGIREVSAAELYALLKKKIETLPAKKTGAESPTIELTE
jgi:hypothetical protein